MSAEASREPLAPGDEQLVRVAALARERAYAPYSTYRVGAAIRTKRNKIHSGANVENASYGLTMCAERVAAFTAAAAGDAADYDAVAVVVAGDVLPSPCGACRQVLAELAPGTRVVLATTTGLSRVTTLGELLPEAFGAANLPGRPQAGV